MVERLDQVLHVMKWEYCLVTNEAAYYRACEEFGVPRADHGTATDRGAAAVTFFKEQDVAIVCILGWETKSGIEIAGLLVHEATHIVQRHFRDIGEHEPSDEFQAYAIQRVSQNLMESFWRKEVWNGK